MTTTNDPAAAAALAAAIEAAAEIAKNSPLFYSGADTTSSNETTRSVKDESNNDSSLPKNKKARGNTKNSKHFTTISKSEDQQDAEKRLARSRERNREHARRTRLRKKAQLEALQARVTQLEDEGRVLKQSIEECSTASILVGLSSGNHVVTESLLDLGETTTTTTVTPKVTRVGKRKRFVVDDGNTEKVPQPLMLNVEGKMTLVGGGKTHINWKSGVYSDEHGMQHQLTTEQIESLRRERNRMHAKMTRDRKKSFISSVEKTIQQLEGDNERMRKVLSKVAESVGSTPLASPKLAPSITPDIQDECVIVTDVNLAASKLKEHVDNSFNLNTA